MVVDVDEGGGVLLDRHDCTACKIRDARFATNKESSELISESWSRYLCVIHCYLDVYFYDHLVWYLGYPSVIKKPLLGES